MTYRTVPNHRKLRLAELAHPCPEAGGRSRTVQPQARLDRWEILRDLVVDAWSNRDEPRQELLGRHLGALSPVEADLIRRMFLNVERILPLGDSVIDLEGHTVSFDSDEAGITTSVQLTFSLTHPDGTTEHVRLKTGRAATSLDEAAVVWASAEAGESFADLMAWPGEVEPIEAPSDLEGRLHRLVEMSPILNRSGIRPGPACVWCVRSAVCGAYPADRIVPTNARTVNLTKTDVEGLERCHRRVAWRRVHGIPRDDGDDVDANGHASQGRLLHAMVAAAHDGDDPEGAVAAFLTGVPPSEVADLQTMWDNHLRLLADEGLTVRATEFPLGITLLEGEAAQLRGVTLIGFVDLTARDTREAPVVVELKTGRRADTAVEDDLYAVGMQRWIGSDEPMVIHRHYLGGELPECVVVTMDPGDVGAAAARLRRRVASVDDWDWGDPLQPAFTVGAWCATCEYRATCESYR